MPRQFVFSFLLALSSFAQSQTSGKANQNPSSLSDSTNFSHCYPGGEYGFIKFLTMNVKYPAYEKDKGIDGTVVLSFIVTAQGEVSAIKVVKAVTGSKNLENEAIRVLKKVPDWKTAIHNGMPTNKEFNLVINFKSMN